MAIASTLTPALETTRRSGVPAAALAFWPLHIAGWTAFAIAMIASRLGIFPLVYMIVAKGSYALFGALISLLLRQLYRHLLQRELSLPNLIVVGVIASYAAAVVWTAVSNGVTFAYIDPLFRSSGRRSDITLRSLTNGSLYDAFILLAWSVLYFGIKWQQALVAERERVLRAESMAHEARLEALRYQLNPHFLFNALNGVSTLVLEQRTQQAAEMLSRLAAFLRMTLEGGRAIEVPLDDELLFVRAYVAIEQARFGDRLHTSFDIAPEARRALVPTLLLQPLVENAVRHAVSMRLGGAEIAIMASVAGGKLQLTIADRLRDGALESGGDDAPPSFGIGLSNTRERLTSLYGDKATLTFERNEGTGARVDIVMPLRPSRSHD